jgi:large subunit ribosomal protein L13
MAPTAAATAMAAQFASMAVSSPSTSAAKLSSSFTANNALLLPLRKRVSVVPVRPRSVVVQAKGGFIPAEHRWMYEGIEKMGPDVWNTTYYPKADDHKNVEKKWYIVDATDKRLGRLASTIAIHIRGKNVPAYTPSTDMGAYVVVINAEKVAVTGKKREQKLYRRHSGRPGGMTEETFDNLQRRIPQRIVEAAVRGMLPKGRLGRRLFTHLKVYEGSDHPHIAQQPAPLPIADKRINIVQ